MTTKLYRLDKADGSTGWMEVRNETTYQPPIDWREATQRERLWHMVSVARFSWIELVIILVGSALIRAAFEVLT